MRGLVRWLSCSQATSVPTARWSAAPTTTTAPSAARSPLRAWPAKSRKPGASRMLILKPLCSTNPTPRLIEIFRLCSSGSKSMAAVLRSVEPIRATPPEVKSIDSARVVLPSCE